MLIPTEAILAIQVCCSRLAYERAAAAADDDDLSKGFLAILIDAKPCEY